MGEQTGLHPVVVIVSIFWGTALGGIRDDFWNSADSLSHYSLRLLCKKYFRSAIC